MLWLTTGTRMSHACPGNWSFRNGSNIKLISPNIPPNTFNDASRRSHNRFAIDHLSPEYQQTTLRARSSPTEPKVTDRAKLAFPHDHRNYRQHRLCFLPEPQGQGSLRPTFCWVRTNVSCGFMNRNIDWENESFD
jgi:hypothetical protein